MLVKIKDVVNRVNNNVDRFNTDIKYYLGKGHGECGEIAITEHGDLKEDVGLLGFKFHFAFKPKDTLFFSRSFALRKAGMAMYEGLCSDSTYILRSKDESVLLPEYLPAIIQADVFWDYCNTHHTGGVNFLINWSTLAEYEFELPSLSEQRVIADKLWAAYRLKESYKKLFKATDEMVKSQFIEMFKAEYPKSEWNKCLTITNGKKYNGEYQQSGTYPICGSGGVIGYGEQMMCPKDTIILGRKGNINSPIFMNADYWIVDTAFCLDADKSKLNPLYFYYWCKLFDFTRYNKQGVLPSLTKNDLQKIEIAIPPMAEQEKFEAIYKQADKSKYFKQIA